MILHNILWIYLHYAVLLIISIRRECQISKCFYLSFQVIWLTNIAPHQDRFGDITVKNLKSKYKSW